MTEKAMAPHSSTLAWKTPWTEEPGGLQSMGSLRVGYDWATSLSLFTFLHWRRKWHPTPVFLPRESQGRQSLVGCRLWGRTELHTTEVMQQQQQQHLYMNRLDDKENVVYIYNGMSTIQPKKRINFLIKKKKISICNNMDKTTLSEKSQP